mmetsp:Transcript_8243/g.26872  ORF Transcript_8243/g.26872 Transcript_8243/m.26872 type:complete len:209 (-) Transcript_8243:1246-1872(-)
MLWVRRSGCVSRGACQSASLTFLYTTQSAPRCYNLVRARLAVSRSTVERGPPARPHAAHTPLARSHCPDTWQRLPSHLALVATLFKVRLVLGAEQDRVQESPAAVLHIHTGRRLSSAGHQLDTDAVVAQRVGRHVVDVLLEELVVVLVVDGGADVRHHLLRRQRAVGDVRVHRVIEQGLDLDVQVCAEPLHELVERIVVHDERDCIVD